MSYEDEAFVYAQLKRKDRQLIEHIKNHAPDSPTFRKVYKFISSISRAYSQMRDPVYVDIAERMMVGWENCLYTGYPNFPVNRLPSNYRFYSETNTNKWPKLP